jgi:glutaredoxin-like protein NrdH
MDIKVFSKNNCMQCKMVKRFLDEKQVAYQEINIDVEPEYVNYLLDKGFQSLPVVESEKGIFSGFAPNKLKELLA